MAARLRRGFTLVELLVVITIIGILVSLLMPAVQAAREAARRTQCINNLHQEGIACTSYHAIHGALPPPGQAARDETAGATQVAPFSWQIALFPYMDLDNVYKEFNFDISQNSAPNTVLSLTVQSTTNLKIGPGTYKQFVCPSDPDSAHPVLPNRCNWYDTPSVAMGNWYAASLGPIAIHSCPYACSCSVSDTCFCCRKPGQALIKGGPSDRNAGMFDGDYQIGRSFDSIQGGISNTILIGETLPHYTVHSALVAGTNATCNVPLNVNLAQSPDPPFPFCQYQASSSSQDLHGPRPTEWCDGYKSMHSGVVNMVMCDGSVHSVNKNIDYRLLNVLGSRKKLEPASLID